MSDVMTRLREEHRNIARILQALERQLALFGAGEQPDYDMLTAIAAYFRDFPDRCHHPKEDLVFRKIREKDPALALTIEELESEHKKISALAQQFEEALHNILQEAEIPRSAFSETVGRFVSEQRRHMEMEEERFFPLAEKTLTAEDWAAIDAEAGREADPLFESEDVEAFAALRDDILKWERENDAAKD